MTRTDKLQLAFLIKSAYQPATGPSEDGFGLLGNIGGGLVGGAYAGGALGGHVGRGTGRIFDRASADNNAK